MGIVCFDYLRADAPSTEYGEAGARRCRAIKLDGSVCNARLSIYTKGDDICNPCHEAAVMKGVRPKLTRPMKDAFARASRLKRPEGSFPGGACEVLNPKTGHPCSRYVTPREPKVEGRTVCRACKRRAKGQPLQFASLDATKGAAAE